MKDTKQFDSVDEILNEVLLFNENYWPVPILSCGAVYHAVQEWF